MDRAPFVRFVHDAFARLDDPVFLVNHPLSQLLIGPGRATTPDAIRRTLVSAIEQLRPPEGTPSTSANWRRWQCLLLRFVDGLPNQKIAQVLMVSDRQVRRDQLAGVDAIAAILVAKHSQQLGLLNTEDSPRVAETPASSQEGANTASAQQADLESELTRLSTSAPGQVTGVGGVVESVLSTTRRLAESNQATIAVSMVEGLSRISLNESTLRQIMLCVVTWALEVKPSPQIAISAVESDGRVEIKVSVKAGQALPARSDKGDSDSLLETIRHLVEANGGTLYLGSSESEAAVLSLGMPTGRHITVLVVDDNPDVVQLFRRYLAGTRYHLVQARTPATALERARSLHPAVVTLDVMMPSQDGWQILQQLQSDEATRDIPVVICSVLPERALAESLGVAGFLAKPVTAQSLRMALEKCLAKASQG